MDIIKIISIISIFIYICALIGFHSNLHQTGFVRAKGLWKLIPFRVNGWIYWKTGEKENIKWIWQ